MNYLKVDPIDEKLVVNESATDMILADLEAQNLTRNSSTGVEKLIAKYQARLDWFDSLDSPKEHSRFEPYVLQEIVEDLKRIVEVK